MIIGATRCGFAVATAVFTLVVVGALALGTLFAATHELRSGAAAIHQARAIMAAELGVEQTIAGWDRRWNGALGRGFGRTFAASTPEGAHMTVHLTRLADELFLISAEARAGPARRHVARIVRLPVEDPPLLAAVGVGAGVNMTAAVDGADRSPAGWDCPPSGPPLPPHAVADTSALLRLGHLDWNALVAVASTHLTQTVASAAPRSGDEECDTAAADNWGEPVRSNGGACTSHYPVLHAAGDLVVDGGRGQGMLLVEGDLTLQGGFEFFGAVLVRGALRAGPGGARITGTVSLGAISTAITDLSGIVIELSRCAVRKALLGVAVPEPIVERSWYDVLAGQ